MSQSIGAQLKQIRESQGIALETIAHKTHITLAYLQAVEAGDEDSLPSKVHLRGFLRLYAHELGVDLDDLQVSGYHLSPNVQEASHQIDAEDEPQYPASEEPQQEQKPQPELEPEPRPEAKPDHDASLPPPVAIEPESASESGEPGDSSELFRAIGKKLKQRRVLLSLSIQDIHENIHIRQAHLESIELGNFDELSSPVQAKGMLVNYADFLNMDTNSLLLEYTDALQLQRIEKQKATPKRGRRAARELSPTALSMKNFFSLDLLVITTLFIAFAIFVIWGVNRILADDTPIAIENDIPGVSDVLLATDTPTPVLDAEQDTTEIILDEETGSGEETEAQEEPLFTPVLSTDPIHLILVARQRLWVQVTVDDEVVFQGRLLPGNAYDFSGQEQVDILTGNAGALQIRFNNQDIGSPGLIGQVASLSFTESGLVLPPPTGTPTMTETPETTPTPAAIDDQTD